MGCVSANSMAFHQKMSSSSSSQYQSPRYKTVQPSRDTLFFGEYEKYIGSSMEGNYSLPWTVPRRRLQEEFISLLKWCRKHRDENKSEIVNVSEDFIWQREIEDKACKHCEDCAQNKTYYNKLNAV